MSAFGSRLVDATRDSTGHCSYLVSSHSKSIPAGQSSRPLDALIWPVAPISTNRLPQDFARDCAYERLPYGSFVLATMVLGNGRREDTTSEKPVTSVGKTGPTGSGTATSNAPRIGNAVRTALLLHAKVGCVPRFPAALLVFQTGIATAWH